MKGIELSTTAVILIVLGIIVLLAFFYLITTSKGQVDVIQYQTALRNCCGDRSIYDCLNKNVQCKVPWSDTSEDLLTLAGKAGVSEDQLNGFCFCPTT